MRSKSGAVRIIDSVWMLASLTAMTCAMSANDPGALMAVSEIRAGNLWCQFGVINEAGARIADAGGVSIVNMSRMPVMAISRVSVPQYAQTEPCCARSQSRCDCMERPGERRKLGM